MNETTYIYIVHSDINENNIYSEFATEEEAIDYARRHADELTYVDKVEVALTEEGEIIEMFDSETIWVYDEEFDGYTGETEVDEFDMDFEDEYPLDEGIQLKNRAEQDEFFRLCDEIGIYTANDIINFKKEMDCTDENILQALRDYRAELGPDFKIANPELEREMAKKYEDLDFDALVEELEEHEDIVECKECYDLVPKETCHRNEAGKYVCEKCAGTLEEALKPRFFTHTAYGPYKISYFDGGYDAAQKSQIISYDPNKRIRVVKKTEDGKSNSEFMTLGEFADLLDSEGIRYVGQNGRKPITEDVENGLTPDQIEQIENYLSGSKYSSLEAELEDEDTYDQIGLYLAYRKGKYNLGMSIYHAADDNNAEYPERHTDEEDEYYDSVEEAYDDYPEYIEALYYQNEHYFVDETDDELFEAFSTDAVITVSDTLLSNKIFKAEFTKPAFFDKAVVSEDEGRYIADKAMVADLIDFLNKRHGLNLSLDEAIKMTRDELMDKEGTDNVDLINAGRPEEKRVELVEE